MLDTKQKILGAAKELIAERGYAGTSLRHIIARAGVNLASIHYHFGSKEELLDELIADKIAPINRERIERLEKTEAEAAPEKPAIEAVLRAFMQPMGEAAQRDPQFVKVMGRIVAEGLLPGVIAKHFQPVIQRFVGVLREIVPELPEAEFEWRTHFMVGAIAHTMCNAGGLAGDFPERVEYLIRFAGAGLCAPAAATAGHGEQVREEK